MTRQSTDILKQTIQFFGQHNLSANPINYTVCYENFTGNHPLLSDVINKATNDRAPISSEDMQRWFNTFLLGFDFNQSQAELDNIANQLALTTSQAADNVVQFDNSLKDCKNELNGKIDSSRLSSIVSQLSNSASSMMVAMEQMKQQLHDSEQEIAALQESLESVTTETLTDPLTGLVNRKGLSMAMKESISRADKSTTYPCLLMLDIDHFKKINDKFGHLLGDKAIVKVADTLKNQIQYKGTASRYGGEEFSVLMPETELKSAWTVAENIRRKIENLSIKRANDKKEICRMTISIGVARYQSHDSIADFIGRADNALYQSKNTGRNRVTIFDA